MFRQMAIAVLAVTVCTRVAFAQTFPTKPVRVVIPSAPGSGIDRMGRLLAEKVSAMWGQAVIIDNRAGGAGALGTELVAKSAADGYTALIAFTSVVQTPLLLPKVPYDIERDLLPVTMLAYVPLAFAVRADSPYRTVAEFLTGGKTLRLSYGTFGNGSTPHIYSESLARGAAIELTHVPYKGEALALTDVLGGQITASWGSLGLLSGHHRAGKVRVLAIASLNRMRALPEVPTFLELGYQQFGTVSWSGLLVPAGTPRAIVERMNADFNRALGMADVAKTLSDSGIEPAGSTPEAFAETIRVDSTRWRKMIQESGITAN